jgi:SAM-dependent methyltransferase
MHDNKLTDAISRLIAEFSWNKWFIDSFWPENEYRVRLLLNDALTLCPPPARVFDIGCANGFISFLFNQLGYQVVATDAASVPERPELFERHGIEFFFSNLNETSPFPSLEPFDFVIMGEVIEHILNHPLGLMRAVAQVTKPAGVLVLTTPNPATLINAFRMLRGGYQLWGTPAFIEQEKIREGKVTDIGDVHFREYLTDDLKSLLLKSGFTIKRINYFAFGSPHSEAKSKRLMKTILKPLTTTRLFAADQYIIARRTEG